MAADNSKINHSYFNKIDSSEKAYFLGLLAADGNVYRRHRKGEDSYEISLKLTDQEQVENFKEAIDADVAGYKTTIYDIPGLKKSYKISFTSNEMARALEKFGVIPNKTQTGVTMKPLLTSAKGIVHSFILGFFDGDGSVSISKQRQQIKMVSATRGILEEIQTYLRSCLIYSNLYEKATGIFSLEVNNKIDFMDLGDVLARASYAKSMKRKRYKLEFKLADLYNRARGGHSIYDIIEFR